MRRRGQPSPVARRLVLIGNRVFGATSNQPSRRERRRKLSGNGGSGCRPGREGMLPLLHGGAASDRDTEESTFRSSECGPVGQQEKRATVGGLASMAGSGEGFPVPPPRSHSSVLSPLALFLALTATPPPSPRPPLQPGLFLS